MSGSSSVLSMLFILWGLALSLCCQKGHGATILELDKAETGHCLDSRGVQLFDIAVWHHLHMCLVSVVAILGHM